MVDIVEQLCIKSFSVTAENGDHWEAEQGKTYSTTVPEVGKETVVVFSSYWVPVPKDHFVVRERNKR
jgi:hypothetical protein